MAAQARGLGRRRARRAAAAACAAAAAAAAAAALVACAARGAAALPSNESARPGVVDGPRRSWVASVEQFGAVGDGATDCTRALEAAVAAAAARGGDALLVVPPGVWVAAPLNLTSGLTLWLARGATLRATDDAARWPVVAPLPTYGTGRDHVGPRRAAFLGGEALSDVVLTGANGTVDGQGARWWAAHRAKREGNVTRGHLVELMRSKNLLLSNLTLRDSPFWTVHPYQCAGVVARRLTILAPEDSPNTDGIDPDSSQDVLIEDCYIATGDDSIAIKSGWDCAGVGKMPTRNVTVRRLTSHTVNSASVCIGSEMSAGVSGVEVHDCAFLGSAVGMRIKSSITRGGTVEGVHFHDNVVNGCGVALELSDHYGGPNPVCAPVTRLPTVRAVRVENTSGSGNGKSALLSGLDGAPITGVAIRNWTLTHSGGWSCDHVNGTATGGVSPPPCTALSGGGEGGNADEEAGTDWLAMRAAVAATVWEGGALPTRSVPDAVAPTNVSGVTRLTWRMNATLGSVDHLDSHVYHSLRDPAAAPGAARSSDTLVVHHHGHAVRCTPTPPDNTCEDPRSFYDLYNISDWVHGALGSDVAFMYMPLYGPNQQQGLPHDHSWFAPFQERGEARVARFFLEPVALTINYAHRLGYKRVVMMGKSGGGWTTTLYAAIDARVAASFPIAGSIPLEFHHISWDFEQKPRAEDRGWYLTQLPRGDYERLYALAALEPGRFSLQVLHQDDPCCFYGRDRHLRIAGYDRRVAAELEAAAGGRFSTAITDWNVHAVCQMDRAVIAEALSRAASAAPNLPSLEGLPCDILHEDEGSHCPYAPPGAATGASEGRLHAHGGRGGAPRRAVAAAS